jgi:hypothetical protein
VQAASQNRRNKKINFLIVLLYKIGALLSSDFCPFLRVLL